MPSPLTARSLILDLLLAVDGEPLSARDAIGGAALIGIRENSVRIALMRLSADGLIEAVDRGVYRLSGRAHELAGDIATWRSIESRTRAWSGDWLVVHGGALGRSDRGRLKSRRRALEMLGFRTLEPGLAVRPDNIERGVEAVRARLVKIGLEAEAAVFIARDFDAARATRIAGLWDGPALDRAYHRLRRELDDWRARAERLELEVAAREALLMGRNAIRHVVFDPLLPAPMVDVDARQAFFDSVRAYDRAGQAIWRRLRGLAPALDERRKDAPAGC